MNKVHYSSESDEWETPQALFDDLNREFRFQFDLCASKKNHKCNEWTDDIEDHVNNEQHFDRYWMNPPYSRGKQKKMVEQAVKLFAKGKTVVCLLPSRTDTTLFHEYIWDKENNRPLPDVEVRFLQGRVYFEIDGKPVLNKETGKPQPAPFPSFIVVFKGREKVYF